MMLLFSAIIAQAQSIPSSAGTKLCAVCVPNAGWQVVTGTPDVSDRNTAATNETSGGGATWDNAPLPLPPNGHQFWISIRDVGAAGPEEAIKTTMTGLIPGREYEVTIYSLSATSGYAGKFIDKFDFQVGTLPRVNVNNVSQNVWGTNKLRFTATAASMDLTFYPGNNSGATAPANFECVNISVTLDAINQIPIAENKTASTTKRTPIAIDAVENALDYDGTIVASTVDLDPTTPGLQKTVVTFQGTWTVNSSGIVTFTAAEGFRGVATIPYTLQDNYSLDGVSAPGISSPKTISVFVAYPELTVTKVITSAGPYDSTDDVITYNIVVTNTGNVTIDNIVLTDANAVIPAGDEDIGTLAPGGTTTITVTHAVTQADLNNGSVSNQATAAGEDPNGDPVTDDSDDPGTPGVPNDPTDTDVVQSPALTFVKTGVLSTDGNTIDYTFTVTNIGNVTIDNIEITDVKLPLGVSLDYETLAPGGFATGTVTYTVTQTEKDAGVVENDATVTGTPPGTTTPITPVPSSPDPTNPGEEGDPTVPTEVLVPANPALTLLKTGVLSTDGNTIDYTFTVTNIGNVTIDNIEITDAKLPLGVTLDKVKLAPGGFATGTATYTVIQTEKDAGVVENDATVTGTPPGTTTPITPVPSSPDPTDPGEEGDPTVPTEVLVPANPALTFLKTGVLSTDGNTIDYTFTVTNIGNVTIDNIEITDAKLPLGVALDKVNLAPGDFATGTATYTVTQMEKDAGVVENDATVTGTPPGTTTPITPVPSSPDPTNPGEEGDPTVPTEVPVPANPALTFLKTGVLSGDGNTVAYTFTVTNSGNVTIDNIEITDVKLPLGVTLDKVKLAPGDFATGTATFTVTQTEKDSGVVENDATVTGTPPGTTTPITPVPSSPDPADPGEEGDPKIPTEVLVPARPSLSIVKAADLTQFGTVGEKITYTITVRNTGNVTLTNVRISDVLFPGQDRIVAKLAPGGTVNHSLTYTVLQSDIDKGYILNKASVGGMDPKGNNVPPRFAEINIPSAQSGALRLTKSSISGTYNKVGDVINYNLTLTNTGNVTITGVIVKDDNADVGSIIPAKIAKLEVGESIDIIAKHTVTQSDLDQGYVYNIAKTVGKDPKGKDVETASKDENPIDPDAPVDPGCPDCTITPIEQAGSMKLTKSSVAGTHNKVGDVIGYNLVLTNTGNVTVKNILITDDNADAGSIAPSTIAELKVGESVNITAKHTITQADLDQGYVYNIARAAGKDPKGKDVETASKDENPIDPDAPIDPDCPDCTITPIERTGKMALTKTAKPIMSYKVGDAIVYELVLTNTGNVTMTDIFIKDDNADAGSLNPSRIDKLEPGQSVVITARHTITQKDKEVGYVYNIAKANGKDPSGKEVEVTSKDSKPVEPGTPVDPNCPTCTITPIEEDELKIPNVFTPNGDGRNDTFVILGLEGYDNAELTIFNRWGNEVYRNRNYKNNWDGSNLNEGTYYYLIILKKDGKESVHKGWVLLKR